MDQNISRNPLEIERLLQEDDSGEEAKKIIGALNRAFSAVSDHMRQPMAQAEYRSADQLLTAIAAANKVVRSAWEAMHSKSLQSIA